jgi:hypothetical protein
VDAIQQRHGRDNNGECVGEIPSRIIIGKSDNVIGKPDKYLNLNERENL